MEIVVGKIVAGKIVVGKIVVERVKVAGKNVVESVGQDVVRAQKG